jgi:hypothetical protein
MTNQKIASRHILFLIGATAISRFVAWYFFHVRFDDLHVDIGMQLIDPELLKTRLLESVAYLHSQPPLFNLYTGILLKIFPYHYPQALSWAFKILGLLQTLVFYGSLKAITGKPRVAFYIALFLALSPAYILYENWFMYTFPAMCLLSLSIALLVRFLKTERMGWGLGFFFLLSALCLTVSMFHLFWLLGVPLLLAFIQRRLARKIMLAAAFPTILVAGWYLRSEVLFGQFNASTWLGMNLARIMLGKPQQMAVLEGDSAYSLVRQGLFKPVEVYEPYLPPDTRYSQIPVLRQKLKSTGSDNFNNLDYIYVSEKFKEASLRSLKTKPLQYLDMVGIAHMLYFAPSSEYFFLKPNRDRIDGYDRLFTLGRFGLYKYIGWANLILLIIYIWVFRGVLVKLGRHYRLNRAAGQNWSWQDATLFFVLFTILYLFVLGNWLELGENMRFRFYIIPFFLLMVSYCPMPARLKSFLEPYLD